MALMTSSLGAAIAAVSAVAFYVASPHCRWTRWRRWRPAARLTGALLAVLSLGIWCLVLGPVVGVCAMLTSWMLAMVVMPWLAVWMHVPDTSNGNPH